VTITGMTTMKEIAIEIVIVIMIATTTETLIVTEVKFIIFPLV
jgi:hypothetical protein